MSLVLVIDSVHTELLVGLVGDDGFKYFLTCAEQRQHDKNISGLVRGVLQHKKVSFSDIDAFAVVVGPGSWTGCRVGVAAVKGFCAGEARPVIALNSLDIIATGGGCDSAVLRCNLDKFFVKRGDKYSVERLEDLRGFAMFEAEKYREELVRQVRCAEHFMQARDIVPFYISEFEVKR